MAILFPILIYAVVALAVYGSYASSAHTTNEPMSACHISEKLGHDDDDRGLIVAGTACYTISKTSITQHSIRNDGVLVGARTARFHDHDRIKHMRGGVLVGENIYVCNSPDTDQHQFNTIEVFDKHLNHKYHINLSGGSGVLMAIDFCDGRLWGCLSYPGDRDGYSMMVEIMHGTVAHTQKHKSERSEYHPPTWTIRSRFIIPEFGDHLDTSDIVWVS